MTSLSASKRPLFFINQHPKEPTITVKGQRLQVVDKFTYLGSTLSRVVHIDDEVNARIAKAGQHLADYVVVFGIEVESGLKQS